MKIVDTNVIAYLLLKGKYTDHAKELLKKDPEWAAPILWKSEYQNILATYVRNRYLDLSQAFFLMEKAEELMQDGEYKVQSTDVLELAAQSGCSAYDCEFIALAKNLGSQLITTDKKLLKTFPEITKNLLDFDFKKL